MRRWAQESVDQERGLGEILDSCQQTQGIPKAMSQVKSNKGVTMNRGEESSKNKPPLQEKGLPISVMKDEREFQRRLRRNRPKEKEVERGILETKESTWGRHDIVCQCLRQVR